MKDYVVENIINGQYCRLVISYEDNDAGYNFLGYKFEKEIGKEVHYHSTAEWSVAFCVADTKELVDNWFFEEKSELDNVQTGRSLGPLMWAKRQIVDFIVNKMPMGTTLSIEGTDDKRNRAYRRILKDIKKLDPYIFDTDEVNSEEITFLTIDKGCIEHIK